MKKHLKKISSAIMAFAMLLTLFSGSAFAATVPTQEDRVEVSVSNVESGVTVTGYKIVTANYGAEGGLTGYEVVDGITIADITAPTEAEIAAIVKAINDGITLERVEFEEKDGVYSAEVGAGSYLVLVSDASTSLYNPMLISAGYDEDSILQAGTVDAEGNFVIGSASYYAKKSEPTVKKEIVDSSSGNDKGDDLAVGDEQNFKITTVIPDYSAAYTKATFTITDTLKGLSYEKDILVTVGGAKVPDAAAAITASGDEIVVAFKSDYVLAHGNEEVVVTYVAKLNEDAGINYDANTNTVNLTYTNNPIDDTTGDTDDITYHYTFGIDANLGGTTEGKTSKTHEIIKVDENGEVTVETVNDGIDTFTTTGPLENATFKLTNKDTGKEYTAVSDEKGYLSFTGLDAGNYTLVETEAPAGFALNTTEHTVNIAAAYNPEGTLKSYSITIDGVSTSTYSATYDADGTIKEIKADDQTTTIKNTRIKALPSTGGMGTYLFTIAGVFVMAAAVLLFVFNRKRVNK